MEKLLSWQALSAGVIAFFLGYGSQVYAFASWQTATDQRLINVEDIVKELHGNNKEDHDKIVIVEERTQNILDRLDRIGMALKDIRDGQTHK